MPTFEKVELIHEVDIDFEVFCGTCGAGLCHESDTRKSRSRNYLQVTVNACPKCLEVRDEIIKELQDEISELKERLL